MTALSTTHAITGPRHPTSSAACSALRSPEDFSLPAGYRQQERALTHDALAHNAESDTGYWTPERIGASGRWQRHVYIWAAELITSRGFSSVLDLGCGPGTKLAEILAPVCDDVHGADQTSAIQVCKQLARPGTYCVVDLESPEQHAWRKFDLIVCADVIEHLLDPDHALALMRDLCLERSLVLMSTPDRARLRGRDCNESPKPEHVREWSEPEFLAYLGSRGWEIIEHRMLPGDDAPIHSGLVSEYLWRARLARTSPHRCTTVLCRPTLNNITPRSR